jgi:prepilin signal peptidase PulO-like enzyme (type II secretory pathway)
MDEQSQRTALLSALTTEHFVLQTANSASYLEASARSTLYVMALSSSLVAMGFLSGSAEVLIPFAATVLPTVFLIGIFTVVRLVETALESMHYLDGIASIRGYYRTLGPDALRHFAPRNGRWPEVESPATRLGPMLGFFGTTASMIAVINNAVAGAGIALLTHLLSPSAPRWLDAGAGVVAAFVLTWVFYVYQRWRFSEFTVRSREPIGGFRGD